MTDSTLLTPRTYRLQACQDAWLQIKANQQGHGDKAVVLRLLVARAMKQAEKRSRPT